ncbi:MAG: 3-hydroxyacyl-CoA dehydrogenase family protein [Desulfobacterales bacterium]|nr:MAG: 3-hydroxyacyl-CoA dehydrogenase family protein [Desulfobacterales bacterium]
MPTASSTDQKIATALVVGAGTMGHGVAQLLAMHAVQVHLVDQSDEFLQRARSWIADNLDFMVALGELAENRVAAILGKINFTTDLTGKLAEAAYVLEAVNEDFGLKRRIWAILGEKSAPEAILASNTSSYDINELAEGVAHPERIVGTHWFHPPQITPCVEVIPAAGASQANIERVMDFLTGLGKVPTICRSAPGFVANRIQMALAAEAIALVEEGLATPAEIDRIVKTSFGFRLGAYGPFEIIDQAGADTYLGIYQYLHAKLGRAHFQPPRLLAAQVKAGRLGLKSSAGFYDYGPGAADAMRRDRDRKFYARLKLVKKEWQK